MFSCTHIKLFLKTVIKGRSTRKKSRFLASFQFASGQTADVINEVGGNIIQKQLTKVCLTNAPVITADHHAGSDYRFAYHPRPH